MSRRRVHVREPNRRVSGKTLGGGHDYTVLCVRPLCGGEPTAYDLMEEDLRPGRVRERCLLFLARAGRELCAECEAMVDQARTRAEGEVETR